MYTYTVGRDHFGDIVRFDVCFDVNSVSTAHIQYVLCCQFLETKYTKHVV